MARKAGTFFIFLFLQNYIFRLGFLDGKAGYQSARITAHYTYLKYKKLGEMINNKRWVKIGEQEPDHFRY